MRRVLLVLAVAACGGSSDAPDWTSTEVIEIDIDEYEMVEGIAADESGLYWVVGAGESDHDIWREAGAGGPVLLGSASGDSKVSSLEISEHHAVYALSDVGGCQTGAFSLEDGQHLVLSSDDFGGFCGGVSTEGGVVAWNHTFDGAHVLRDDLGDTEPAVNLWTGIRLGVTAIDGDATYWIGDEALWRHDGAVAEELAPADYVAVAGDSLLWASDGELRESPTASFDGDGAVLASGLGQISDLDADARFVYALVTTLEPDRTQRLIAISRDDGEVLEIAAVGDDYVDGIVARDGGVYYGWTAIASGSVESLAIMFAAP